ncbi:DUF1643 domain-containing protein [Mesorhizobium sp. VNQ89]|uniref:DUF1643 domain-containing protein n=1 Tax=Mesorhizobium quangtriensis TaxID=3157709 RepID=UPI0032B864F1
MSAIFSECRRYRYRLDRTIGSGPPVAFLLHNPSTAGEVADDATSRRGIGFAQALGFGRLIFINPWAMIATKPRDLWAADDPVGPSNDDHIANVACEIAREHGVIVGAWGRIAPPSPKRAAAKQRIDHVLEIVLRNGSAVYALGINMDGSPKHPLYLPANATLCRWKGRDSHTV